MAQTVVAVLGLGVVDPSTPVIRADDAGVTRGDGCFEGIRVLTDGAGVSRADKFDRHLARMTRSAAALEIAFDADGWTDLVDQACKEWRGTGEAALKLVLTRGVRGVPTGFLTITDPDPDYARQRREGIRAITVTRGLGGAAFVDAPWLLGGVKTLSYAVNMAAHREAVRRRVEEAIFVSADGWVLEAPTGSVVWAQGDRLVTTPVGPTGILAGTTQQVLFERAAAAGIATAEALVGVDTLHAADAVWVISSVRGPVTVVELDGRPRDCPAELVERVRTLSGF